MTAILIVLTFVGFIALDVLVRTVTRRMRDARDRREREAILETSVRLEFADEAKSLKRVEVPNPRARILAVDDEPVVLDSFRKILVLDGYNVDTVENGPEALALIRRHDYDFVFTDLKMPDMHGVEVVKAVRHLRPDIDVAVITGYGSIETAVETMQHGAMDYVEKPFTAEELSAFAKRLLVKREARLAAERMPTVRVVEPALAESRAPGEFCVPGGAFLSEGHVWARLDPAGTVTLGLDDFARQALGRIEGVELPEVDAPLRRGETLFSVLAGGRQVRFVAPLGGSAVEINEALRRDPSPLVTSPYDRGWVCRLEPSDVSGDLPRLRIGIPAVEWYRAEVARLRRILPPTPAPGQAVDWAVFEQEFLRGGQPVQA
jgi:CheY-like chemotaxis protein